MPIVVSNSDGLLALGLVAMHEVLTALGEVVRRGDQGTGQPEPPTE